MKSGNLKFLEPSGPLQACDGAALPCIINYLALSYSQTQCFVQYINPYMLYKIVARHNVAVHYTVRYLPKNYNETQCSFALCHLLEPSKYRKTQSYFT